MSNHDIGPVTMVLHDEDRQDVRAGPSRRQSGAVKTSELACQEVRRASVKTAERGRRLVRAGPLERGRRGRCRRRAPRR